MSLMMGTLVRLETRGQLRAPLEKDKSYYLKKSHLRGKAYGFLRKVLQGLVC